MTIDSSRLITSVRQAGGGYRRIYAQDAAHAARARELIRESPTWVDSLRGVDGIEITAVDVVVRRG